MCPVQGVLFLFPPPMPNPKSTVAIGKIRCPRVAATRRGVSVEIFLKCAELQAKSLNREPPPGNYHNRIFGSTDFFIASAPNGQRTAAAGCDPNPRSGASEALAPQRVVCLSLCVRPEKPPRLTEPL